MERTGQHRAGRAQVVILAGSRADGKLLRLAIEEAETAIGQTPGSRYDLWVERDLDGVRRRLQSSTPDAVLLDLSGSGQHTTSTIAQLSALVDGIPVLVMAGAETATTAAQMVGAGACDYLVKGRSDGLAMARAIDCAIARNRLTTGCGPVPARWQRAAVAAREGLLHWDLATGWLHCSSRAARLLGIGRVASLDELGAQVEAEDLAELQQLVECHLDHRIPRIEHRLRRRTRGAVRWLLLRGAGERERDGRATTLCCLVADVTARTLAEQQLTHDAFHDPLTGLANRALFIDRLEHLLARSSRHPDVRFAVLFFDLDGFKVINDSCGHATGDQLLVAIARRLECCLRPMDAVARFGGDELAVLINDTVDLSGAVHVAERIQTLLADGFEIDGNRLQITASIGIVLGSTEHRSSAEVLRQADTAMYRAKAAGKARYEVFDRHMHRSALALLRLEQELRQAVEQQQFVMHYQPIVLLRTGQIVGFEGLVRWVHRRRGLIEPARFIAVAEESGLIVPIGWWVLRQSCLQIRQWQLRYPQEPPLSISVNISRRLFLPADMVDRVVEILQDTQLQPESLRIEIREHVVVDDGEAAINKLLELRALGVRVTVDDFGTGFSSLSYLRRFRCESVKIDPSFVSRVDQAGESRTLVETILSMADTMGLGVIAEGIETADQAGCLRELRCPLGQGFWFARPMSAEAAEQLLLTTPCW